MLDEHKAEAQQTLDELLKEKLIPFKLNAAKLTYEAGECIVHFYDSRLPSVAVSWKKGQSFKALFRAALLDRVSRMSGPLKRQKQKPT